MASSSKSFTMRDGSHADWRQKHRDHKPMTKWTGGRITHNKTVKTSRKGTVDHYTLRLNGCGTGNKITFGANRAGAGFLVTNKPSSFMENQRFTMYGMFQNGDEATKALDFATSILEYTESIRGISLPMRTDPRLKDEEDQGPATRYFARNSIFKTNAECQVRGSVAYDIDDMLYPKEPAKIMEETRELEVLRKEFEVKSESGEDFSAPLEKRLGWVARFREEAEAQGTLQRQPDFPLPENFEPYPFESAIKRFVDYERDEEGNILIIERDVGGRKTKSVKEILEYAFFSDITIGTTLKMWANLSALYTTECWGYTLWGNYILITGQDDTAAEEADADEMDPELLEAAMAAMEAKKAREADATAAAEAKATAEAAALDALDGAGAGAGTSATEADAAATDADAAAAATDAAAAATDADAAAAATEADAAAATTEEDVTVKEEGTETEAKADKTRRKRSHRERDDDDGEGSHRSRRRRTGD